MKMVLCTIRITGPTWEILSGGAHLPADITEGAKSISSGS